MKRFVIILFLLAPMLSLGQDVTFLFRLGLGMYDMSSMKQYQTEYINQSALPLKPVDKFPIYGSFGAELGYQISRRSTVGLWVDHISTGGRADLTDYSGHARFDQLLTGLQYGVFYAVKINSSMEWPLHATAYVSRIDTDLTMKSELVLGTASTSDQITMNSTNYAFRPGLMLKHRLKRYVFQANIGYEVMTHGSFHNSQYSGLHTSDGHEVTAEWDGLRAGIGIGLLLNYYAPIDEKN